MDNINNVLHIPKYRESANAETLIIFIHGFMGSPNQFDDLAEAALDKGYSTLSVLLPGHGGSCRDFTINGLTEWESYLHSEIDRYKDKHSNIYLFGHSMGGLLALNASVINVDKICGIVLLSSPMKINITPKSIFYRVKLLLYPNNHEVKRSYRLSNSIEMRFSFYCLLWFRTYLQLRKLISKTKANLAAVSVPIIMVHSSHDETVSIKSAKILYEGLSNTVKQKITLNQSWHMYYTNEERKMICDEMLLFIETNSPN